jgi:hypothetical protein
MKTSNLIKSVLVAWICMQASFMVMSDSAGAMELKVTGNKPTILVCEPLILEISVKNTGSEPVICHVNDRLIYKGDEMILHYNPDSALCGVAAIKLGAGESRVWREIVFYNMRNPAKRYVFNQTGQYQIEYWLSDRDGNRMIASRLPVTVVEPVGNDAVMLGRLKAVSGRGKSDSSDLNYEIWSELRGPDPFGEIMMAPNEAIIAVDEREAFDAILNEHPDSLYCQYLAYAMGVRYGDGPRYFQMAIEMQHIPYIRELAFYWWLRQAEDKDLKEIAERALATFPESRYRDYFLRKKAEGEKALRPPWVDPVYTANQQLKAEGYDLSMRGYSIEKIREAQRYIVEIPEEQARAGQIATEEELSEEKARRNLEWVRANLTPNLDLVAPVLQVNGENDLSLECETTYTDAGASATDNKDGDITASITVLNNVNPAVPGAYTVVYTVSDAAGNTATATRTVNVVDTTAPVLTCQGGQVHKPETCGGVVNFAVPTALDQCAGSVAVTCAPASGDVLAPGVHTVNCSATDPASNTGTCSFTVDVKERLQVRFVAPLADDNADNNIETDADVVNTFKVGSRVIHKVKLFDCAGNDVTEAYASLVTVKLDVTLRTTTNAGSEVVNDVPEVSSGVGNAGGLMIPVGGHFQYNLDTTGYEAGTVNDGRFYRSEVTVEWVSAPGLAVAGEDALLESKP